MLKKMEINEPKELYNYRYFWTGGPVRDEQLPSKMYVDYVCFFKLIEK